MKTKHDRGIGQALKVSVLLVSAALFVAPASAINVVSGGQTDYTSGYRATYTWKYGWFDGGVVWYDPQSSDNYEFEWEPNLSTANYRWGSESNAVNTLYNDFGCAWYTQDFSSVQQFDSTW